MNSRSFRRLLVFVIAFLFGISVCEAQSFDRPPAHKLQNNRIKGPRRSRTIKVREPRAAEKAKKQAEANERKKRKDYQEYVMDNKKRSIEIQTPVVRERMKQNFKDADANYKAKKKKNSSRSRESAKKYKK